jgi:cell division protein FtsW
LKSVFTYLKGDKVIWMITLILALLSLISVYSFTPILTYQHKGTDTESFLLKHVFALGTGFFLMFYAHNLKYTYYSRISQLFIWVAVGLLFLTLVAGVSVNSADRWLKIPFINLQFQTSDFAKIIMIMFIARMLVINREKLDDFKEGMLPILIPVGLICALILPANFSTAALTFLLVLIMFFIGQVPWRQIGIIVGSAVVGFLLLIALAKINPDLLPRLDTWMNRFSNHASEDPKEQWQINNAEMAIYNGKFFGTGPGNGQLKHALSQAYADFVFASFVEEFGLPGAVLLVLLFLIFFYRAIRIAIKCEKNFGSFLVMGLALNLLLQAIVNMAVCTKLLPVTGQNMPLISMGGTSTWFTCLSIGIILSVSRSVYQDEEVTTENNEEGNKVKEGDYAVA